MSTPAPIEAGSQTDTAYVQLAPELVPLLSAQLYQSPLKAIEELVVNSYDADAKNCYVRIGSTISVTDDGIGMDLLTLKSLWHVGRSGKRTEAYAKLVKRTQIGKFGIGKLAAYSIANIISFYTRSNKDILHATLNFSDFAKLGGQSGTVEVPIFRVKVAEWNGLFSNLANVTALQTSFFQQATWTTCILTNLKEKATQIKPGRLAWVLRTAMPILDDFALYFGGQQIRSSKEDQEPTVSFNVSDFPQARIDDFAKTIEENATKKDGRIYTPALPTGVSFVAAVYPNTISSGKSVDLQRSHGFFIKVRGRLINEQDELFGLTPQSYKYWHRFRAVINADDLDQEITASREGVEESESVGQVRQLAALIFNEARSRFVSDEEKRAKDARAKKEEGRNPVSPRLVEIPIADTVSRFGTEKSGADADSGWFYISFKGVDEASLLETLYGPREGVYSYRYESLGVNERLVKFEPAEKLFILNENHPLVREYKDEDSAAERLLQDFVTAEALLEVYLREAGVPVRIIGEILEERDKLIRSLARDQIYSLASIADDLARSKDQQYDLEIAVVAAARALGFIAKHVGGAGAPDGIARFIDNNGQETLITLETKSSSGTPSLPAIDFAGIDEHIKKEAASGSLVVAPAYPGASKSDDASASKRAKEVKCSCWTVDQLAKVVLAAESREISASDVLNIVQRDFAPEDVDTAVQKLLSEPEVSATELYTEVVAAMESLVGRRLEKPLSVDMVIGTISGSIKVNAVGVQRAVKVIAKSSKGLVRMSRDGSEIIILGSFDELRRRLGDLIRSPVSARRLGSFRLRDGGEQEKS